MNRTRRSGPPVRMPSGFTGFRFPPEVILLAVRWYLRYELSYRDLEELLAERGIEVDHVTLYRWVQRFTPLLIDAPPVTACLSLWESSRRGGEVDRTAGDHSEVQDLVVERASTSLLHAALWNRDEDDSLVFFPAR